MQKTMCPHHIDLTPCARLHINFALWAPNLLVPRADITSRGERGGDLRVETKNAAAPQTKKRIMRYTRRRVEKLKGYVSGLPGTADKGKAKSP